MYRELLGIGVNPLFLSCLPQVLYDLLGVKHKSNTSKLHLLSFLTMCWSAINTAKLSLKDAAKAVAETDI
jgi:hypothetical protein